MGNLLEEYKKVCEVVSSREEDFSSPEEFQDTVADCLTELLYAQKVG